MAQITQLKQDLVNKIAAGEVIERPASVVKELMENALDAGADEITVKVDENGTGRIQVIDNGSGMDEEDVHKAFQPHTTSKIIDDEDLFDIRTLGFRGEALASMAAVSHLTITSKTDDMETAVQVEVEAGELLKTRKVAGSRGTQVTIEQLFFNTPARRKHMKSPQTEMGHITDIVTRYAFSRPWLAVRLETDGRERISSPATKKLTNKIVDLYGKETARQMIPLEFNAGSMSVSGLISKPYLVRKDREYQTLFVNGRYVRNQSVSQAVYDAYHTLLFLERHPVYVLYLILDTKKTDVNVHPSKDIIRIENENEVYDLIFNAVRTAFQEHDLIPDVSIDGSGVQPTKRYAMQQDTQTLLEPESTYEDEAAGEARGKTSGEPRGAVAPASTKASKGVSSSHAESRTGIGPLRIFGQLNMLYILAESPSGLMLIDQHAAQERVLFERFMAQYKAKEVSRQSLLRPFAFEVSEKQRLFFVENEPAFDELGFTIDEQGPGTLALREIPQLLSRKGTVIQEIVTELLDQSKQGYTKLNDDRIARMACRAAIKAGEPLTIPRMHDLMRDLEGCEKPYTCPHGRPTMISITLGEIERKFRRI